MKRKHRKQKWNVLKIFVTMTLALICIASFITLRNRRSGTVAADGADTVTFETDSYSEKENIKKIVNDKKYP